MKWRIGIHMGSIEYPGSDENTWAHQTDDR